MFRRYSLIVFSLVFAYLLMIHPAISNPAVQAQPGDDFTVGIIVMDDFTGLDLRETEQDLGPNAANRMCAVNVEGQAYFTRGASADSLTVDAPHGEVVVAQIEELLVELGIDEQVELVEFDLSDATSNAIAPNLRGLVERSRDVDLFIINMSFAMIPCEFLSEVADFQDALEATDSESQAAQIIDQTSQFIDQTVSPAADNRANDPDDRDLLHDTLERLSGRVIAVASAGNFGLDYPFYPGAWDGVLSISASNGDGFYAPELWDDETDVPMLSVLEGDASQRVSNYGEIMLPGEYDYEGDLIIGTSFAAPRMTALLAYYALQVGENYCITDGIIDLAYGEWDNLTLDEAVTQYCPSMDAHLPLIE